MLLDKFTCLILNENLLLLKFLSRFFHLVAFIWEFKVLKVISIFPGVSKTQTSKTQTSDPKNSDPRVSRKLRPRKLRPQTRKTQTLGCLENSDLEKTQTLGCLENSDPKNSDPLGVSKTQTRKIKHIYTALACEQAHLFG